MKEKISLKEGFILALGILLITAAVYYIMMPSSFVVGTLSGLIVVIANFIPLKISTLTLIFNVVLLIVGFIFIGKEFGIKTVIASLLFPLYLRIFEIITPDVPELTDNMLVNVLCFCLVVSMGQSMLFNINASSGGIDIIAKVLNKYLHIDLGKAQTIAGFVIASTSALVYDRNIVVVSLLGTYLSGIILDHFIDGAYIRKKVCILSPKYPEIQKFIVERLNRGVTLYDARGGWDGRQLTELVTILQTNEYAKLLEFVNKTDPSAFITVTTVGKVIGKWNPHKKAARKEKA